MIGLIVTKTRNDISIKFMNIYVLACDSPRNHRIAYESVQIITLPNPRHILAPSAYPS